MATHPPLPTARITDPPLSERMRAAVARSTSVGATPEAAVDLELRLRRLEGLLAGEGPAMPHDARRIAAIMAAIPPEPPPRRRRRGLEAAAQAIARWLGAP